MEPEIKTGIKVEKVRSNRSQAASLTSAFVEENLLFGSFCATKRRTLKSLIQNTLVFLFAFKLSP